MDQLTVRGFDADLARRIRALARRENISLSKAALRLLRRGAGLDRSADPDQVGDALDAFVGSWSAADQRELLSALEDFERVDTELWR